MPAAQRVASAFLFAGNLNFIARNRHEMKRFETKHSQRASTFNSRPRMSTHAGPQLVFTTDFA